MSKSTPSSPPAQLPMEQPQPKFKAKVALVVALSFLGLVIAWATHLQYANIKDWLWFSDSKIKNSKDQTKLLSSIAYHFSAFLLANVFSIFLLTAIFNFAFDHPFVMAARRNIGNSLEQFVIFIGFYAYVLLKGPFGFSAQDLVLLANWFLLGRYLYAFGSFVEAKTGFNAKQIGSFLNAITLITIIAQIWGVSILQMI